MLGKTILPEFKRIQYILHPHDPSEVHGMLCGMLCVDNNLNSSAWLNRIMDELPERRMLDGDTRALLLELFHVTESQLCDASLGFYLLLPADEISLSNRVNSLGRWCQGFLAGLGLSGMGKRQPIAAEIKEFLLDLTNISQVVCDAEQDQDEEEQAFTEIVEYVRVGVLTVHQEFQSYPYEPVRSY